jgi:hypothetical protein
MLVRGLQLLQRANANATRQYELEHCTLSTCNITSSYYYYRISLPVNAVFLALFSISLLGFLVTYAVTRRATAFTFAFVAGVALEVIGYVGRIQLAEPMGSDRVLDADCVLDNCPCVHGWGYLSLSPQSRLRFWAGEFKNQS